MGFSKIYEVGTWLLTSTWMPCPPGSFRFGSLGTEMHGDGVFPELYAEFKEAADVLFYLEKLQGLSPKAKSLRRYPEF